MDGIEFKVPDWLKTPLLVYVVTQSLPSDKILMLGGEVEDQIRVAFEAYAQQLLVFRDPLEKKQFQRITVWLEWLAKSLQIARLSIFRLDELRIKFLARKQDRLIARLVPVVVILIIELCLLFICTRFSDFRHLIQNSLTNALSILVSILAASALAYNSEIEVAGLVALSMQELRMRWWHIALVFPAMSIVIILAMRLGDLESTDFFIVTGKQIGRAHV